MRVWLGCECGLPGNEAQMTRIMTATEPNAVTITIDGKLLGESVEAVDTRISRAIGLGRAVQVFLGDITDIDQSGRALLSRLAMRGVHLSAARVQTCCSGADGIENNYDEND